MLTLAEARRIALAAQGFGRPRSPRRFHDAMRRIGALQLDFVNVLVPAHFLTLYARLGPYDRGRIHRALYGEGRYTEQWAHEAAIVPMQAWPWLRFRRDTHRIRPYGFDKVLARHPDYAAWVLDVVREHGPLAAAAIPRRDGVGHRLPESWIGTVPRAALEAHFGAGRVAIAGRLPNFTRLYDLAGRVIPEQYYRQSVDEGEGRHELIRCAARSCGVATAADLADYYRMRVGHVRPHLEQLLKEGELESVRVEGWREPAYLHTGAARPRRIQGATLLSPFDPLVWFRPRVERLFGFEYRIEIYTPAPRRRWGYYVLPFLLDEQLVARVDLKAGRDEGRLRVLAAWLEPGQSKRRVQPALLAELRTLAGWLGLDPPRTLNLTLPPGRGENRSAERE